MKAAQLYFQNAAARLSYEPEGYLRLAWTAQATNESEVRAIYEHLLAAPARYQTGLILSLQQQRPPISLAIQSWLVQEWFPRINQLTLKVCIAVVQGPSPIGRLAVRSMTQQLAQKVRRQEFEHEAEALAWLLR
jgi:hypothetical protein